MSESSIMHVIVVIRDDRPVKKRKNYVFTWKPEERGWYLKFGERPERFVEHAETPAGFVQTMERLYTHVSTLSLSANALQIVFHKETGP